MSRAVLPLAALTQARLPPPDASFAELAGFAWLDDRYEKLETSGELDRRAAAWDASEPDALSTDDLRSAMLLQQRRVYWQGGGPDAYDERRMRALADELRQRLLAAESVRCAVWTGDLTRLAVDAVVNAANERMLGGGGVDGTIHRAAGPALVAACRAVPEVAPGVRCPTGEARITPAFQLPATWVIHTVGPVWRGGAQGEDAALAQAYESSLEVAAAHGAESVAFPAISTGVYGFPRERAARIATDVVRGWQAGHELPARVLLVAFDDTAAAILQSAAE